MEKIDYTKVFREAYDAGPEPVVVAVPPMRYLCTPATRGAGSPWNDPAAARLGTLAGTVLRLLRQGPMALDHTPMPLEWLEDELGQPMALMIMQPQVVDDGLVRRAVAQSDGDEDVPRLEFRDEGRVLQLLQTDSAEPAQGFARLEAERAGRGLAASGARHGIVLRTRPLQLLLRLPVQPC